MTDKLITLPQHREIGVYETPQSVVEQASMQAKLLMSIVEQSHCYQEIAGKKYLQVEAWETIGAFNRVYAMTDTITPITLNGDTIGYQAKVLLYRDGQIVGGASMPCYFTENCCKGKEGDAKHKACMSAAQTFATSKAYRMNYAYVAIMAGYQPTPAEEMDGDTKPIDNTQNKYYCQKHKTEWFKRGNMRGYAHPVEGTKEWCSMPTEKPAVDTATGEIIASPAPKSENTATPEGKQGQTNPMTAIATEAQWTRIGELGHKTGHSTKSVCEYVGKKTDEWRTVTVAQAGDIINWLSGLKPVQSEKDMKLPFEGE